MVDTETGTDLMNELSIEIFMFLVSSGDGVGIGEGVGEVAVAVLGLPPHATTRKPTAITARRDLSILKVLLLVERVKGTSGLYRLGRWESSGYGEMRRISAGYLL